MLSRRTGQTLVRLFQRSAKPSQPSQPLKPSKIDDRWLWLVVCVLAATIFGIGEITAKRPVGNGRDSTKTVIETMAGAIRSGLARALRRDITATPVTTVSAASFESTPVSPEAIVAAFGVQLATQTVLATDADPNTPGIQLPTQLGGTTVEVNGRRAGLFFVSSGQINYLMPTQTEFGTANVVVRSGDGTVSNGTVIVAQVAPAVFSANSNGRGVAAANVLRVKSDFSQSFEAISQFNQQVGRFVTKPIDLGPTSDTLVLVLYLTGIRKTDDPNNDNNFTENIRILIGGNEITPIYAGRQPDFVGLDQVNAVIPRSLIGRGVVNVSVSGTGFTASNLVDIEIAGAPGTTPPQVSGFGAPSALAGNTLVINGTGFSPTVTDNVVKIAGLDATVMSASATQLIVMVPFGVESGTVSVRTLQGEGVSANVLPVRTSISGLVENTARQPIGGLAVKVEGLSIATTTDSDGVFVLPDVPTGLQGVEVDGSTVQTDPPYPKVTLKISAQSNRDNRFSRPISLQQATGSGGTIGSGSSSAAPGHGGSGLSLTTNGAPIAQATPDPKPISIQTGDFQLVVPAGLKANFPNGATSGSIFLTPLQNARTPVDLPFGYYSSSIVQITPFNVKLDPGAKLIFPNTDGFPFGSPAVLFRYNPDEGRFVQETIKATVSADGQRIETEPNAIKITSFYFAAVIRQTTTITGRVLDNDNKTPVPRVLIRFRGQEATTDGNGSYVLRYVPVKNGEPVQVEASYPRANNRVDRVLSASVPAVLGGITKIPDLVLPGDKINRPPTILITPKLEISEGRAIDVPFVVTDPDSNQISEVKVDGARFASVVRYALTATSAYTLRLAPGFSDAGDYTLKLTATDSGGASSTETVALFVKNVNRAPVAKDQAVTIDEDTMTTIKIEAIDADGDRVIYSIVAPPTNGALSSEFVYKPLLNFNGTDQFTFKANDGTEDSNIAKVTITVRPVNDPPVLAVPAAQTINEGQLLSFAISATDPDAGQTLIFSSVNQLPAGATLTTATPTSAQFTWTPNFSQSGVYTLAFKVTDNGNPQLSETKAVRVTVNDVRVLLTPEPQKVNEGQSLLFNVSILGASQPVTITATGVPEGAVLSNPTAGGRQFRWTPSYTQAGNYVVTFKATSDGASPVNETKDVLITVFDVQRDLAKEPAPFTVYGGAGQAPAPATDSGDQLGASVAVGDLNNDGISDFVVGAPAANGKGLDSGQVYVFFGKANLANPDSSIDLARQTADASFTGEVAGDHFGASLAIGDLNGDGKSDLIIGAPLADAVNRPDAGKVYVIFGGLTPGSFEISKEADVTINGAQRSDRFGASLAAGLIHTKNGPAIDLAVGAPGFDVPGAATPVSDAGAVYTFFGAASLPKSIDLGSSSANLTITGLFANAQMGMTLAAGNFNGDDFVDLAIGAPLASVGVKANGVVYLVPGAANLTGVRSISQAAAFLLIGGDDSDNLGAALAMGDLNADGRADLVIGAPGGDGPDNTRQNVGEVFVIYGAASLQGRPADLTIYGVGAPANSDSFGDALGSSLAIGDFTGDGIMDLAIGAPGADLVDAKRRPSGAAYLLFGARAGLTGLLDLSMKAADLTIYGADSGDGLGAGGIAFADVNAAEVNDLIIGIPQAGSVNNSRVEAGEVRVLWGVKR